MHRAIETAKVIEELIQLAKDMRRAAQRGALGAVGWRVGREGANPLAKARRAASGKVGPSAHLRVLVKLILRKYGYPPDLQEKATQTVLEQAEVLSGGWATELHAV